MPTFILVHGAWHGGWCWKKVRALLQGQGHEVWVPTLTGLGDRGHLLRPEIGLRTHLDDIAGLLEFEDLAGVTLAGHSYGGMVIAGAAAIAPYRVSRLVFLDGVVPDNGDSLWSLFDERERQGFDARIREAGDGWKIPPPAPLPRNWAVSPEDAAWMEPRLTPQPLRTFQEAVVLERSLESVAACTFISCTSNRGNLMTRMAERAQSRLGWHYHEIATGHDAMVAMPLEVARLLTETAG